MHDAAEEAEPCGFRVHVSQRLGHATSDSALISTRRTEGGGGILLFRLNVAEKELKVKRISSH